MKAQFVTYGDLGTRQNLKTKDIAPAIEYFKARGVLGRVLSRLGRRADIDQRSVLPLLFFAVLGMLRRLFRIETRAIEETIFDWCAKSRVKTDGITFVHPPRFQRSMRFLRSRGSLVVGIATNSHPAVVAGFYADELRRQGIEVKYDAIKQERYYTEYTDYLIALSPFSKQTYVSAGYPAERIYVAGLDVDTEQFRPALTEPDGFIVLFPASSIGILKGLQYVLDAWGSVTVPNKKLIILGSFHEWPQTLETRYRSIIASDPTIEMVGTVRNPETYYHRASVSVLPTFTEGFSRAVAESLACGVPVITTHRATDTESFFVDGTHGILVPPGDAPAIAHALNFFASHEHIRAEMGRNGRALVTHKPSFGSELFAAYEDILSKHR